MTVLQELVREHCREDLLVSPDKFNPVPAYDIQRFERIMVGSETLPADCAALHIFRVAREKLDAQRLADSTTRVARFGTNHVLHSN